MEIVNKISDDAQKQVNDILRDGLYEGYYGLDLAVRFATSRFFKVPQCSSRFFNFIHSTLDRKIEAFSGSN